MYRSKLPSPIHQDPQSSFVALNLMVIEYYLLHDFLSRTRPWIRSAPYPIFNGRKQEIGYRPLAANLLRQRTKSTGIEHTHPRYRLTQLGVETMISHRERLEEGKNVPIYTRISKKPRWTSWKSSISHKRHLRTTQESSRAENKPRKQTKPRRRRAPEASMVLPAICFASGRSSPGDLQR